MAASDATLAVANHAEFNRRGMSGPFTAFDRAAWDAGSLDLADQSLLWGGRRRVALLPAPCHPLFPHDVRDILGLDLLKTLSPARCSPFLSRAALADADLMDRLAGLLGPAGPTRLLPWGASFALYPLAEALSRRLPGLDTEELPPRKVYWSAQNIEGKAGARLLLEGAGRAGPAPRMPEGHMAASRAAAADIAASFLRRGLGVAVKANHGAGGFTVRLFPPGARPRAVEAELEARARHDGFWRAGPYVVEALAQGADGAPPLCATSDWRVEPSGRLSHLGTGRMTIRQGTRYAGVTAGLGALDAESLEALKVAGRRVGRLLFREGYRGLFDLDAVRGADGLWLVHEVNLRRASPAHALDTALALRGKGWEKTSAVRSEDRLFLGGAARPAYEALRGAFFDFNRREGALGLTAVPSTVTHSLAKHPPYVGYVVVAPDAARADAGAEELARRLRHAAGCPEGGGAW